MMHPVIIIEDVIIIERILLNPPYFIFNHPFINIFHL